MGLMDKFDSERKLHSLIYRLYGRNSCKHTNGEMADEFCQHIIDMSAPLRNDISINFEKKILYCTLLAQRPQSIRLSNYLASLRVLTFSFSQTFTASQAGCPINLKMDLHTRTLRGSTIIRCGNLLVIIKRNICCKSVSDVSNYSQKFLGYLIV